MCFYDVTSGKDYTLPREVLLLNAFSIFWYQTMDAIDGKQARKTDNCSCLGQLLDHNLDQFSHCFFSALGISLLRCSGKIIPTLMIINGQLLPQFTIEYRKYFTNFHATVVEMAGGIQIGATECCLIMYGLQLYFACLPDSNTSASSVIDAGKLLGLPFELSFTKGEMFCASTFALSLQYNIGNFMKGF